MAIKLQEAIKGFSWLAVGEVGVRLSTLLLGLFVAAHFGSVAQGRLAFAVTLFSLAQVILECGLTPLAIRESSRDRASSESILRQVITVQCLLALGLTAVTVVGLRAFAWPLDTEQLIAIYMAATFPLALTPSYLLQVQGRFRAMSATRITGQFMATLSTLVGIFLWGQIQAVALGFLIGNLVTCAVTWFCLSGTLRESWRLPTYLQLLDLLQRGLPFLISNLSVSVYYYIDILILSIWRPEQEVGVYFVAVRILLLAQLPSELLTKVMCAPAAEVWLHQRDHFRTLVNNWCRAAGVLGIGVCAALVLFAEPLVRGLFGPEYMNSVVVLRWLALVLPFVYFNTILGQLLIVAGLERTRTWITVVGAVVNVSLNLLLVSERGGTGAAWASLGAETVVFVLAYHAGLKADLVKGYLRGFLIRPGFAAIMTLGGFVLLTGKIPQGFVALTTAALYLGAVFVLHPEWRKQGQ